MILSPVQMAPSSFMRSKSFSLEPITVLDAVLADLEKLRRSSLSTSSPSLLDSCPMETTEIDDESIKLAETWNSLGLIRLHMQKDAASAKDCHEAALKILEGTEHRMEMVVTLSDLGYCYERLNQQEDALKQYFLALRVLEEEQVSKEHPRMMTVQRAISRITRS